MVSLHIAVLFCLCLTGLLFGVGHPTRLCLPEVAANIKWTQHLNDSDVATFSCSAINPRFQGGVVRRACVNGSWTAINFSECTLHVGTKVSLLLWLPLLGTKKAVLSRTGAILRDVEEALQVNSLRTQTTVNLNLVDTSSSILISTSVLILVQFPQLTTPSDALQVSLSRDLPSLWLRESYGGLTLSSSGTALGYKGFHITSSCSCWPNGSVFDGHCSGNTPVAPCTCQQETCQCSSPEYVGDGQRCTNDVDEDSFPEEALDTCTNATSNFSYCIPDNCPLVYNPSQLQFKCVAPEGFTGCPSVRGNRLDIIWGNTLRGEVDIQGCPAAEGFGTRRCLNNGQWDSTEDVSGCMSYEFDSAFLSARNIFARGHALPLRDRLSMAISVTSNIVSLTRGGVFSLLPMDLNSTNQVLAGVIDLLEESLTSDEDTEGISNSEVLDIFSNVLNGTNLDGWLELTQRGDGTPKLLDNIERYALYQSRSVDDSDLGRRLWQRSNVAITFQRIMSNDSGSVRFPESLEDLTGSLDFDFIPAQIELPMALFKKRHSGNNVPSSSFLVRNMELAMPTTTEDGGNNTRIASMILSSQVDGRGRTDFVLVNDPVKLSFQFDEVENATQYRCAYWKFSDPVGNGYWAFDGVEMTSMEEKDGKMVVNCSATHLTSFAVLVIVSSDITTVNEIEQQALTIVSYIGCGISVFFLLITIIFFLIQGRDLCVKVHYFIHLNLAITLCLGYFLFAAGIETAAAVQEACIAVAVVLHYLFLSSFCWMLCEGIMLYLLLVVVFSKLSKQFWFFLLIGYALPVVPVVVTVGIRYDNYGVVNDQGNLTFCWLSTDNGVIWAFVGPMLAIIMVNMFFMIMAVVTLYRTKRKARRRSIINKNKRSQDSASNNHDNNSLELFKTLLMAVIVLLPMLGLTWVLGLFAVNRNTTVFAWIFTIFNSLQGFFIFLFHVVRSDKVWKNPRAVRFRSTLSSTYRSKSSSSSIVKRDLGDSTKVTLNQSTSSAILLNSHSIADPNKDIDQSVENNNTDTV